MKIGKHSQALVLATIREFSLEQDYWSPALNYLLHGYEPGSFFTAMFANDMLGALGRSHPANSVLALKDLSFWIKAAWPTEAYGSYERVNKWTNMTDSERELILVDAGMIYSSEDEAVKILKGEPIRENFFGMDSDYTWF